MMFRDVATPRTKTTGREGLREKRMMRSRIAVADTASTCLMIMTRGGLVAWLYF